MYDSYDMGSMRVLAGTVAMTLWVDPGVGSLAGMIPTKSVEQIADIVEKIEDRSGLIEIPSGRFKIMNASSADYPHGFWYTLATTCADSALGMPEIQFTLDEGAGPKHLFWGRFDPLVTNFGELYLSATKNIRTVEVDLLSSITRIKDLLFVDFLTELKANRAASENPTGTPSSLTVTFSGMPDVVVYKYRVAARDANGEYAWSTEATVSNSVPTLNNTGDHNHLSFTGVAGAVDYAIYRTYHSAGGSLNGFIGVKGSGGGGTITFDDIGYTGDNTAVQSHLCARQFITLPMMLRCALQLAFGQGYMEGSVNYDHEDIQFKQGAAALSLEQVNFLLRKNFNTFDPHADSAPAMDYAEYFNDGTIDATRNGVYFGQTFQDVLTMLGHICKHVASYPRYFYDVAGSLHCIELLARGRQTATSTPDGNFYDSSQVLDSNLVPKTVHAYRSGGKGEEYPIGGSDMNYDLDFGLSFVVQDIVLLASQTYEGQTGHFYGRDYQQLYSLDSSGGKITASRIDGVQYYDYGSASYKDASSSVQVDMNGAAYLHAYMQEAFVKFWQTMTRRYRKSFRRCYDSLKTTTSAVSTQGNSKPCMKVVIDDGISSKTFYANEVKKNVTTNELEVAFVQT